MALFHICLITPYMGPRVGFQAVAQWERIPPSLLEGENTDYLDIPDQPIGAESDKTKRCTVLKIKLHTAVYIQTFLVVKRTFFSIVQL